MDHKKKSLDIRTVRQRAKREALEREVTTLRNKVSSLEKDLLNIKSHLKLRDSDGEVDSLAHEGKYTLGGEESNPLNQTIGSEAFS